MTIFIKDPAALVDHVVDWAAGYLGDRAIAASAWQVAPAGLSIAASRIAGGRTVATLAGGAAGLVYRVTNQVEFSDGQRDERTLVVRVEER